MPWQMALLEESMVRIDSCGLSEIPHEVLMKDKLKELVLSHNVLGPAISPGVFGLLVHVRVLRIDHNGIQELPAAIGKLGALTALDLSFNQARLSPPPNTSVCKERHHARLRGWQGARVCACTVGRRQVAVLLQMHGRRHNPSACHSQCLEGV